MEKREIKRLFCYSLLLLVAIQLFGGSLCAQDIRGRRGECTKAIFDRERPILILHQDSLGRTLSLKAYSYAGDNPHPADVTHYRSEQDWKRVSYEYDADTLVSVTVFTPAGREEYRFPLGGREKYKTVPKMQDPALEWRLALEGSRLCEEDSLLSPDPLDGETFLFASDGRFLCRVQSDYADAALLLWRAAGKTPLGSSFADPVGDPLAIGPETRALVAGEEFVSEAMQICGAGEAVHHGLLGGCLYLLRNSGYGGLLDFAVREEYGISPAIYYLTDNLREGSLAHNRFNFGNYLWGASARETGVPLWLARLGAHISNFLFSPDCRGSLDTPDDQLSICAGFHWH